MRKPNKLKLGAAKLFGPFKDRQEVEIKSRDGRFYVELKYRDLELSEIPKVMSWLTKVSEWSEKLGEECVSGS